VRTAIIIHLTTAMLATSSLSCGSRRCTEFCSIHSPAVIFEANDILVTHFDSSCDNIHLSASRIIGELRNKPATCHVDILLADGEQFAFDVPFTQHIDECCCNSCIEGFDAVWQPVAVNALPPLPDASPFPPTDASDAAPDVVDD